MEKKNCKTKKRPELKALGCLIATHPFPRGFKSLFIIKSISGPKSSVIFYP